MRERERERGRGQSGYSRGHGREQPCSEAPHEGVETESSTFETVPVGKRLTATCQVLIHTFSKARPSLTLARVGVKGDLCVDEPHPGTISMHTNGFAVRRAEGIH